MSSNDLPGSVSCAEPWNPPAAANDPGPALQARLATWVGLTEEKRRLEAELRKVQDQLTATEGPLIEDFTLAGFSSATLNGFTVYRQREFFCRPKDGVSKDTLIATLREAGLDHCIGLQHQTLRALSKEWAEAGEQPPAAVAAVLDLGDNFRLRTRKS